MLWSQGRSIFRLPCLFSKETDLEGRWMLSATTAESGRANLWIVSFGIPGQPDSCLVKRFEFLFRIRGSRRCVLLREPFGHFLLLPFFPLLLFLTLLEGLWSTTGHKSLLKRKSRQ